MTQRKRTNNHKLPKPKQGEATPYVAVLLEEVREQYRTLTEGLQSFRESAERRLDNIEERLTRIEFEIIAIKAELRVLQRELKDRATQHDLEQLKRRVMQTERELATLRRSR